MDSITLIIIGVALGAIIAIVVLKMSKKLNLNEQLKY